MPQTEHRQDATPFVPDSKSLKSLRTAAGAAISTPGRRRPCSARAARERGCSWSARCPGDREDRAGKVFVGPAGRELDQALEHVGIERADVYITNVVKHFEFEERAKRRIHQTGRPAQASRGSPHQKQCIGTAWAGRAMQAG